VMNNDVPLMEQGQYPEAAEYYALFADQTLSTLIDYMPGNSLVLFDEWDSIHLALDSLQEKYEKTMEEGLSSGRLLPLPRLLHLTSAELGEQIRTKQRAFLSTLPNLEDESANSMVQFDCHGVERFNSQMQQFVEKVRQWKREGFRV